MGHIRQTARWPSATLSSESKRLEPAHQSGTRAAADPPENTTAPTRKSRESAPWSER